MRTGVLVMAYGTPTTPDDVETYVHRIGRTGRAGAKGIGITLVAPSERGDVRKFAGALGLTHLLGEPAGEHRVRSPQAIRSAPPARTGPPRGRRNTQARRRPRA